MDKKKSLLLLSAVAAGTALYNILKPVKSEVAVVTGFEIDKYLGDWYEVARLDFRWERNLKNVKASYSLNDDGTVCVNNQGYDFKNEKYKQSIGKARFLGDKSAAALEVSFFGPFYSGYNVVQLDADYQYALIFGQNLKYMWLLSRKKTMPEEVKTAYLAYAQQAGYSIGDLIWTIQD